VTAIGVGNPYRCDDGAGPAVAARLRALLPSTVDVVDHDGEPAGLLDLWEGADLAFVVDAVVSDDPPGTVHRVEVTGCGVVAVPGRPGSSHALGLGEAVELARVLDRLPARLVVVGITGARFGVGLERSAAVDDAVEEVAVALADEIAREVSNRVPE
jgi:hydrogenase maturation protease